MSQNLHFREVQHFTTGTQGPKGQRVFYLQFGNSGELMTLKLKNAGAGTCGILRSAPRRSRTN